MSLYAERAFFGEPCAHVAAREESLRLAHKAAENAAAWREHDKRRDLRSFR